MTEYACVRNFTDFSESDGEYDKKWSNKISDKILGQIKNHQFIDFIAAFNLQPLICDSTYYRIDCT